MMYFLKISGDNAKNFLQGQLTCDVNQLHAGQSYLGAHCNQKGRVLFNFLLLHQDEHYYMKLPANMLETAKNRLEKFAVFSKVTIEPVSLDDNTEGLLATKEKEIEMGFVTIYPETSGLFTPHELNYPQFENMISFTKGCYTGQEIVARMQYLGKLKKHLYHATINTTSTDLLGCSVIDEDRQEVGLVADYAANTSSCLLVMNDNATSKKIFIRNVTEALLVCSFR